MTAALVVVCPPVVIAILDETFVKSAFEKAEDVVEPEFECSEPGRSLATVEEVEEVVEPGFECFEPGPSWAAFEGWWLLAENVGAIDAVSGGEIWSRICTQQSWGRSFRGLWWISLCCSPIGEDSLRRG